MAKMSGLTLKVELFRIPGLNEPVSSVSRADTVRLYRRAGFSRHPTGHEEDIRRCALEIEIRDPVCLDATNRADMIPWRGWLLHSRWDRSPKYHIAWVEANAKWNEKLFDSIECGFGDNFSFGYVPGVVLARMVEAYERFAAIEVRTSGGLGFFGFHEEYAVFGHNYATGDSHTAELMARWAIVSEDVSLGRLPRLDEIQALADYNLTRWVLHEGLSDFGGHVPDLLRRVREKATIEQNPSENCCRLAIQLFCEMNPGLARMVK